MTAIPGQRTQAEPREGRQTGAMHADAAGSDAADSGEDLSEDGAAGVPPVSSSPVARPSAISPSGIPSTVLDLPRLRHARFRLHPDTRIVASDSAPGLFDLRRPQGEETSSVASPLRHPVDAAVARRLDAPGASCGGCGDGSGAVADLALLFARLSARGLLEMQTGDGPFRSGPASLDPLFPQALRGLFARAQAQAPASHAALVQALALRHLSAPRLAGKLYRFNTLPGRAAPEPLPEADARFLRSTPPGWIYWNHRARAVSAALRHKVYLSPVPSAFGETLQRLHALAADCDVTAYKCGAGAQGAARPDKLVVYFADAAERGRFVARLEREFAGIAGQGVPFARPLDPRGFAAMAEDPPPGPGERVSWRAHVAREIAGTLAAMPAARTSADALEDLLRHLLLARIDLFGWMPDGALPKERMA